MESSLRVILQGDKTRNNHSLFLRLSINGGKQQDFAAKKIEKISGLKDTFIVSTSVPRGMNVALIQLGRMSSTTFATTLQMSPNSHIVDMDGDTLIFVKWGHALHKLALPPGPQIMFILQAAGADKVSIYGSIQQGDVWTGDVNSKTSIDIPHIGSIAVVPRPRSGNKAIFKLVPHHTDTDIEEPLLDADKEIWLPSSKENSDTTVIVTRWNAPAIHRTEIGTSKQGCYVRQTDPAMEAILKDTADMYRCINECLQAIEL